MAGGQANCRISRPRDAKRHLSEIHVRPSSNICFTLGSCKIAVGRTLLRVSVTSSFDDRLSDLVGSQKPRGMRATDK